MPSEANSNPFVTAGGCGSMKAIFVRQVTENALPQ